MTATTPMPAASMCYDSNRFRVVMIGASPALPSTWEYDGTDWQQRAIPQPPMSGSDRIVFDSARSVTVMFVQGGGLHGGETWEYDGTAWVQRATTPAMRRTKGDMVFDPLRNRVVMQGGVSEPGAMPAEWTWEYDGTTWVPYQGMNAAPCNDFAFAFDVYRRRAVKVGGIGPVNGTCEYHGPTGAQWINSLSGPANRAGAAMAYDAERRECVLFGGRDIATNARFGDTQRYRTQAQATVTSFGQACLGSGPEGPDLIPQTYHVPYVGMPFVVRLSPTHLDQSRAPTRRAC